MTIHHRKGRAAAAALLALGIAATASCSDSSDEGAAPTSPAASPPAAITAEPEASSPPESNATDSAPTTSTGSAASTIVAANSDQSVALDALITQASDESGPVVFFVGSGGLTDEQLRTLGSAASKTYGVDIEIASGPVSAHPAFIQQMVDEASQGVPPSVDLVASVNSLLPLLNGSGLLEPVDFAELGAEPAWIEAEFPGVRIHDQLRGVVYNTDQVTAEDVPNRYEDLLDSRWANQICAPGFPSLFTAFVPLMGLDEALEFTRALVDDQQITLVPTITDAPARVASGECAIALGADTGSLSLSGAAVADADLERTIASGFWASPVAGTGREAKATLVALFLASEEGQELLATTLAWSREPERDLTFLPLQFQLEESPALEEQFKEVLGVL